MKMKSGMMMSHSVNPPQAWSNCARTPFGSPNDLSSAHTNGPITVRRNMSAPLRMSSETSRLFFAAALCKDLRDIVAFHIAEHLVADHVDGEEITFRCLVGAHIHAEAVRAGFLTSDEDEFEPVTDLFVERINGNAVVHIDLVQAAHCVHIAALEKYDHLSRISVRCLHFILCKEEKCL